MATLFTRIIRGELPGRFVWRDDACVAFLSIHPLRPGHVLVVPIEEIDHWVDLPPALLAHLTSVGQTIARAQAAIWRPEKVGMMFAGLEVPHCHLHLVPITEGDQLNFANADVNATVADLDRAAELLRGELRRMDASGVTDA